MCEETYTSYNHTLKKNLHETYALFFFIKFIATVLS